MPTMIFSAPAKYWKPKCTNQLKPETSVNGEICLACIIPEVVVPECGGTATWGVGTDPETTEFIWELVTNECTGTGTPQTPADEVPGSGWIAITDCCTGETIDLYEESP